ncbi:MAG: Glycosyl hydrolase family 57 [Candidatus Ozemobacter sibiricus]|jgi:alpha-amylase/alpha-mannosidase (GH57 family)|uniref:Glycosyl hydrolase family 57 n=1 Tax=Candidatus Ozemobacter sibiricus TaxID=2268124 RepID=A0A367ZTG6_9BACT|nr:MAG: Glycosyl hydrolase family 57 [Candidatus Ozemobacter sibiricus]
MKYLAILLHLYQPPTQLGFVVDDIVKQCYEPLVDIFNSDSDPRFTLNINYSLTEQLLARGHRHVVDGLRRAAERGTLEFVDSGAYHPIFPLIPESEVRRQLELNRRKNQEAFGPSYQPKGVFPPEMCFSGHLAQLFHELGYQWCITDDLPYSFHTGTPPYDFVPTMHQVRVFLRSNTWSNDLSFHTWKGKDFVAKLQERLGEWFGANDGYLIIAMDGETFGHHHKYYEEKFLRSLLYSLRGHSDIKLVTISELAARFPGRPQFVPPSTWSASMEDLCNDDPYPLWHSKFNPIHHNQWVLTNHVMQLAHEAARSDVEVRELLDKAIYSCQYWWASAWNFDPSQVFRGAYLLLDTLERACRVTGNREALRVGRDLYNNLVFSIAERLHGKKN